MESLTLKTQRAMALEDLRFTLRRLIEVGVRLAETGEPEEHRCLLAGCRQQLDAVIRLLERAGR